MTTGSGLGYSIGMKTEGASYGVYAAPDHFVEPNGPVSLKATKERQQGTGLHAAKLLQRTARRVTTSQHATGSIPVDIVDKGLGLLLQALMGSTAAPVLITGSAYTQTHTLADPIGKSLTIQQGLPRAIAAGTVDVHSFLGCRVMSAEFECDVDGILTGAFEIDSQKDDTGQSLSAPSYLPALRPFNWLDMNLKIGTFGSESSVLTGVKKVSVKIDRKLYVPKYAGNAGLSSQPLLGEATEITWSVDFDYVDKTVFSDRWFSDAGFSLVWEFVGPTAISGANFPTFRITLPGSFVDDEPPTVDGEGVISTTINGQTLDDGTNSPSIVMISSDSVL